MRAASWLRECALGSTSRPSRSTVPLWRRMTTCNRRAQQVVWCGVRKKGEEQTAGDDRGRDECSKDELEHKEVHQDAACVAEPHCGGWCGRKTGCDRKKTTRRKRNREPEQKKNQRANEADKQRKKQEETNGDKEPEKRQMTIATKRPNDPFPENAVTGLCLFSTHAFPYDPYFLSFSLFFPLSFL